MANRLDLPPVAPEKAPSLLNWGTGQGLLIGLAVGTVAAIALGALAPALTFLVPVVKLGAPLLALGGAVIGGAIGSVKEAHKQQDEALAGRTVKQPTFLNNGLVTGLGIAALAIAATIVFAPAIIPAVTGALHGLAGFIPAIKAGVVTKFLAGGLFTVGGAVVTAGAAVVGSVLRKNEMDKDLARGESQAIEMTRGVSPFMNSVGLSEYQQLESKLKSGGGKGAFADMLAQQPAHGHAQSV